MGDPIQIRLDDDVREGLQRFATEHGIGLATVVRQAAAEKFHRMQKARCQEQSAKIATSPSESVFFADIRDEDLVDFFDYGTLLGDRK